MSRSPFPVVPALLLSAAATMAQVPEVVHTLSWMEVYAGTNTPVASPNGVLEPGEATLLRVSVSFTPVGTLMPYHSPYPGGIAPIAGMGESVFRIRNSGAEGGDWSHWGAQSPFMNRQGSIDPTGVLVTGSIQDWPWNQPVWQPDPINPVPRFWEAVWTPSHYAPRIVEFGFEDWVPPWIRPFLWVTLGYDPTTGNWIGGYGQAQPMWGPPVQFPVVPAPWTAAVIAAGCAVYFRRSRPRP
jgi:hypothetical protein